MTVSKKRFGYYGYDGEGRRALKLAGHNDGIDLVATEATLYVNPYFIMDLNGAMKHYYAGTERFNSARAEKKVCGFYSAERDKRQAKRSQRAGKKNIRKNWKNER